MFTSRLRRIARQALSAGCAALLAAGCSRAPATHPVEKAAPPPVPPIELGFEVLLTDPPNVPGCPVAIVPYPDASRFFVLGRDGELFLYDQPLRSFAVTGDGISPRATKFHGRILRNKISGSFAWGDMGTLGLALDPDFPTNRMLYVWYCDKGDQHVILDRFTWSEDQDEFEASRKRILTVDRRHPPAPYHMGGILAFLPDRTLLIASGDAERPELSQDKRDLNGKLLRIKPHTTPDGGYDIPSDNPHLADLTYRPEVVAIGLRAPFRGFLRHGRHLWFGDVGAVFEEIDVWTGGPADFGWGHGPTTDGPEVLPGVTPPLVWWSQQKDFTPDDPDYNGDTRLSAAVGVVYEPAGRSPDRYRGSLTGRLVFFDIMRGWIRSAPLIGDDRLGPSSHIGHLQFISDLINGDDGYIYGVTWARPQSLFRVRLTDEITPAPKQPPPSPTDEPALPPRNDTRPASR